MPFVSPDPPVPRSFRASYQQAASFPVFWSMASFGLNWLFVPASSSVYRVQTKTRGRREPFMS